MLSWHNFYNSIKDPTWPDCAKIDDLPNLPQYIQNEIFCVHFQNLFQLNKDTAECELRILADTPLAVENLCVLSNNNYFLELQSIVPTFRINLQNIDIYYNLDLEGGGIERHSFFLDILKELFTDQKFNSCFEWCSGPGFIGFAILGANLCNQLTLADIYHPSLQAAEYTIKNNPIINTCVNLRHIQYIKDLPESDKFDLVVANPPWFSGQHLLQSHRRYNDPDWKMRKEFFKNIKQHLNPDGIIILVE